MKKRKLSSDHWLLAFSPEMASPRPRLRCQQPGSPKWPQQFCKLLSLIQLLQNSSRIFLLQGSGPCKFLKKALGLGRVLSCWHIDEAPTALHKHTRSHPCRRIHLGVYQSSCSLVLKTHFIVITMILMTSSFGENLYET